MRANDVTLYYLPFDSETYVPVTPESIEKAAICKLALDSGSEEAAALRRMLDAAGSGSFDPRFVRLKAVGLTTGDVFVERAGGLRGRNLDGRQLGPDDLNGLQTLLEGLAKTQGCTL